MNMLTLWNINGVETEAELKALRHSLARGTPLGDTHLQTKTAAILGLESSLRPFDLQAGQRNSKSIMFHFFPIYPLSASLVPIGEGGVAGLHSLWPETTHSGGGRD